MTATETAEARARIERQIAWMNDGAGGNMPVSDEHQVTVRLGDLRLLLASLTPPAQGGELAEALNIMITAFAGYADTKAKREACAIAQSAMSGKPIKALSAIPDASPGNGASCVACDDKPSCDNNPCVVCGLASAPTAERLREAAQAIVAAQTIRGGFYTGWNITALNKAVEQLRSALGMEPTPLSPETLRMMEHASKNRDAIRAALSEAGEERA